MRRALFLLFLLLTFMVGIVFGQDTPPRAFEVVGQLGELRPQGIRYNAPLDQFAMVDLQGRLLLVDAKTDEIQHVLLETGTYNGYEFSHNGKMMALAIDLRVELYDTRTGELLETLEPDGTLSIPGPFRFSYDDKLLSFNTLVRAPQAIRRSENDTTLLPWIFDLKGVLNERPSILPGFVDGMPFFDYRNGFILGPRNLIIGAIPRRYQMLRLTSDGLKVLSELETNRAEIDPTFIWESVNEQQMYIRPENNNSTLMQIDTVDGSFVDIQLNREIRLGSASQADGIIMSSYSQIIGEPHSRASNALLEFLLEENYPANYNYHPLTVTLIDMIRPITGRMDEFGLLLYVFDEETATGRVQFIQPDAVHMVLHPDRQRVMFQRYDRRIQIFNLDSGVLESDLMPVTEDPRVLAYTTLGDQIISDFQRFDTRTGEVLKQNLRYTTNFNRFYFTEDGQKMVTIRGEDWWVWDIASGNVIQQARLETNGTVLANSPDGMRYLSLIDNGVEIYTPGNGQRLTRFFDPLPERSIRDVVPSPDWQHYLVTYSGDEYGDAIVMYDFEDGKMWDIMADDLPGANLSNYGWVNNDTIYLTGDSGGVLQRVLGVEYDASGLPSCLVENFPDDKTRWFDVWERFLARLPSDELNLLAQRVCAVLPGSDEDVEAILFPTATPTEPRLTTTPALVAGVPSCLTTRFPGQALEYAGDWRNLIQGLNDAQIEEMETLLCESLSGSDSLPRGSDFFETQNVMTVDIKIGRRSVGTFIPVREIQSQPVQPVIDAFYRVENRTLNNPSLSRDGQLIAESNASGQIIIYRMNLSYQELLTNLTATAVQQVVDQNFIGVRPTSTQPFNPIGTTRPTLTATMTLTPPPSPEATLELSEKDQVIEMCPANELFSPFNPPPQYAASGRLILPPQLDYDFGEYLEVTPTEIPPTPTIAPTLEGGTPHPTPRPTSTPGIEDFITVRPERGQYMWALQPGDGQLYADASLPRCENGLDCRFSFDRRWILYRDERGVVLSGPDGRNAQVLYDGPDAVMWPDDFNWSGAHLLSFTTVDYAQGGGRETQYIDPEGGSTPAPLENTAIRINDLDTQITARQPLNGSIAVATLQIVNETKYYMVDLNTRQTQFFARMSSGGIDFEWHPFGDVLYYHFSGDNQWYIFDPETWEHKILGELPSGELSPDGRYRLRWDIPLEFEEIERRLEANELIPKLSLWDRETGGTRQYCIPRTAEDSIGSRWLWSPDSRYIAFYASLADERTLETSRPHLLVLDLETGYVVDLGLDYGEPVVWVEGESR